jgi:hypothetical protein|tara:strand:+ start:1875 stop:2042 length:168 start_codon:yes stop_codon:yes gene_type:complete
MADEIIVEGLDYYDFITLKKILKSHTTFSADEDKELKETKIILDKVEEIIQVFKQ